MSEMKGLRFDIFDRVRLTEGTDHLEGLEQIELIPHIEVITQGEQAVLKGRLQLTGQYTRDGVSGVEMLDHSIPVDITLPMNRIPDLSQVRIEIENFDIDLIAPHMLNVTGVLSLSGIELMKAQDDWEENGEKETVFVHHAPLITDHAVLQGNETTASTEWRKDEPLPEMQGTTDQQEASVTEESLETLEEAPMSLETREPSQFIEIDEQVTDNETVVQESERLPLEAMQDIDTSFEVEPEQDAIEQSVAQSEPKDLIEMPDDAWVRDEVVADDQIGQKDASADNEVKIAFAGRQETDQESSANLNSLLTATEQLNSAGREEASQESASEEKEEESASDGAEWKSIFLSRDSEHNEFSSLRMCIVQKEETIESIAQRYNLNPREIMLYNRIGEESIQEGQILYIP